MAQTFKIADILSVHSGVALSGIDGVRELLDYMLGWHVEFDQIPKAAAEVEPYLEGQLSFLKMASYRIRREATPENFQELVAEYSADYGEEHELEPISYNYATPQEEAVANLLRELGIQFTRPEHVSSEQSTLDFFLPEFGLSVEVKTWSTERMHGQIRNSGRESDGVLLLVGPDAVKNFAQMLRTIRASKEV